MFREMKRGKQLLSVDETAAVMERCTSGVLACLGDEDYPYAVPLSFVYFNDKIYFHSAKAGHKIDAITKHPKVSFSVIDEDTIVGEEYTTYSVSYTHLDVYKRQVEHCRKNLRCLSSLQYL